MIDRLVPLVALWLCLAAVSGATGQEARPFRKAGDADGESVTAVQAPPGGDIGVQEAIRLATDALDRLEQQEAGRRGSRFDEVERYIDIIKAHDPGNAWLSYLYGRTYSLAGRQGDAIDELRKFVSTPEGRSEWQAYRMLGDLFAGEFPRLAKSNYEKAAALKPDEPSVLQGLSVCAMKLGATEEAVSLARKALEVDGRRTVRYVSHLASLLLAAGRWDEALRAAEEALALALEEVERRPGARRPLVVADRQCQLVVSALQARIKATDDPDVADYLRLATCVRERAAIAAKLSLHEALRVVASGVERTAPDTPPDLLQEYGILLAEVGRTGEAVDVFQKLLTVDPRNSVAAEWLKRLRPEPAGSPTPGSP